MKARRSGISLVILALLSGLLWRLELEMRSGWHGLGWIGYYHWAIPIGLLLFVLWAAYTAKVTSRFKFGLATAFLALVSYAAIDELIRGIFFVRGLPPVETIGLWFTRIGLFSIWPLTPILLGYIYRIYGGGVHWRMVFLSSLLFFISWPLAILILEITGHPGDADVIHALKSGIVIPFLFISLGIPLIKPRPSPSVEAALAPEQVLDPA